jgi:hypothetical protein
MRDCWKISIRSSRIADFRIKTSENHHFHQFSNSDPPITPESLSEALSFLETKDEDKLHFALHFFTINSNLIHDTEFRIILNSAASRSLRLIQPFFQFLKATSIHPELCHFLIETGFLGHVISQIDPSTNPVLTISGLNLIASIAKHCHASIPFLYSNGIFDCFSEISEFCVAPPPAGSGLSFFKDQIDLFCSLLKAVSHFVKHRDDFIFRLCQTFPILLERYLSAVPCLVHLCVRRLLKFAAALYIGSDSFELISFVVSQLRNDDLSIQELAMAAVVAFSGREDDAFLNVLIDLGFFELLLDLNQGLLRELGCLVLRNFAASRNPEIVNFVLEHPGIDFLTSVIENDHFAAKQRAYFVICYCVIAECPQIQSFFVDFPEHFTDLVQVLTESADRHFLLAAFVTLKLLVQEEEERCARNNEKNGLVVLLVEAGLLDFLGEFTEADEEVGEFRDLLKDTVEQAILYDRMT